jgi:hypothetical protein
LPLSEAVIVAVPTPAAVTMNVALVAPAITATDGATVATAELLLDSDTVAPSAGAAADRVTPPWTVAPRAAFVALSETPATVGPLGETGEPEPPPHWIEATAAMTMENKESRVSIR